MSGEAAAQLVRNLLQTLFEVPEVQIRPDARLSEDLDLDSVDAVELALRLEQDLGLELGEDDFPALETVADLVSLITTHGADGAPGPSDGEKPGVDGAPA